MAPGEKLVVWAGPTRGKGSKKGGWSYQTGTSFAAPIVTGVVALLLQEDPSLTQEEVLEALGSGAVDLEPLGPDPEFGRGLVQARESLRFLRERALHGR